MSKALENMIAAGHKPIRWETGEVDIFGYTSGEYCNGPACSECGEGVCHHCEPDKKFEPCIGKEGKAAKDKEYRRQKFLELKKEFDPDMAAEQAYEEGSGK